MEHSEKTHKILLIADDDEDLCNSLALFFADKFTVKVHRNCSTLPENLASANCLLIDTKILEKTGEDFLPRVRKEHPRVFVVVMHNVTSKSTKTPDLYSKHSDSLIFKPFDVHQLSRTISRLAHSDPISSV